MSSVTKYLEHVRDSTRRMLAGLDHLTESDVARPSLCPGWTVGHLLTHVARSGDGLRRSIEGARRGELVPMYDSDQARSDDIEAGAGRPIDDLIGDVAESARRLEESWSKLDAADWERSFPHRVLGARPLHETPGMRWFEVEIHRVDLAGDYGPRDWPAPFVAHVLEQTLDGAADRLPGGVTVELHSTDTDARWSLGPSEGVSPVVISAPSWAIAAWLVGRSGATSGELSTVDGLLPELAPWR